MTTKSKAQSHIRYKTADGKQCPGVTTILGVLNKPALVKWANNLGLQGIDSSKYVDDLADIGTLAHAMVIAHLSKQEVDTSDYSANQIDLAENCLISYFEWEKGHTIEPVLLEKPMISEIWKFGGTIDCLAKVDGILTLIDFKTGKGLYPESSIQVAAYSSLVYETAGLYPARYLILRIGRDENEGFEEKWITDISKQWELFTHCLRIYDLQKQIKKE